MHKSHLLYSLSKQLEKLNSSLSDEIKVISPHEILNILNPKKPSTIIFEERHIPIILKLVSKNNNQLSRFICISNSLDSEDRLILLNHNIECITSDKFSQINASFFKIDAKEDTYKVLVVEDDENQILITEHILQDANITVKSVIKAEEVIETLNSFKPHLILMDLYLEGTTGDELVKTIRLKKPYRLLPIVFLTSDTSVETRMRVLNAGADDLLTKPIHADLLVSALKNRMQRNIEYTESKPLENQPDITHHSIENIKSINSSDINELDIFYSDNINNESASIIWIKVNNKLALQKELGFLGFNDLCSSMLKKLPQFKQNFNIKKRIAEGVFILASVDLPHQAALIWVEELTKWLASHFFTIKDKDYYFEIVTVLLSDIPVQKGKDDLLHKAENILIKTTNQASIVLDQDQENEEKDFDSLKIQLEKSIKTRNFKWQYQSIIATHDKAKQIYQLALIVVTDSDQELSPDDYFDVAIKTGMLRLLNRFTLERAIRLIRTNEQKNITTIILLKQTLLDYRSKELRTKLISVIKGLNLPSASIVFQFSLNEAKEYMGILQDIGKELKQAKIKICLSDFVSNNIAWEISRMLKVNWIKLKGINNSTSILDEKSANYLPKVIKKSQILCYEVLINKVNDSDLAAELKELNVDYLQGRAITSSVNKVALN